MQRVLNSWTTLQFPERNRYVKLILFEILLQRKVSSRLKNTNTQTNKKKTFTTNRLFFFTLLYKSTKHTKQKMYSFMSISTPELYDKFITLQKY